MIAGIMSVVVIVLSQVFYEPIEPLQKKVATEQSAQILYHIAMPLLPIIPQPRSTKN